MEYLIQEIFSYLIIAFALGTAIGWFVSQQGSKSKIAALEAKLSDGKTGTVISL
jgi:hypothetical protein